MASIALSTVAWAVISTICGRSPSGTCRARWRMRSRPVRSGMTLSTTTASNARSASRRCAASPPWASATSWPSSRRARASERRMRSSSSAISTDPVAGDSFGSTLTCPPCPWPSAETAANRCGHPCRPGRSPRSIIRPPSPSTMFLAMASPRPVPPRRVVKNGSKSRDAAAGSIPGPLSCTRNTTPPPSRGVSRSVMGGRAAASPAPASGARRTACTAFCSTLTSTVRTRSGSVRIGARPSAAVTSMAGPASAAMTAAAASRPIAAGSASCHAKVIGFA